MFFPWKSLAILIQACCSFSFFFFFFWCHAQWTWTSLGFTSSAASTGWVSSCGWLTLFSGTVCFGWLLCAWPHLAYGPPALMRTILTMSLVDPARHGGHHWITSVLLFLLWGLLIFQRFSTSCLKLCVRWLLKHLMMWSRISSRSWTKMNVWPWPKESAPQRKQMSRENGVKRRNWHEQEMSRKNGPKSKRCQEKWERDVKSNRQQEKGNEKDVARCQINVF